MAESEFVRVYGMDDEQSRDVLVRASMSPERREALGVPMVSTRTLRGYTMRRDRLPDLRAVCQHQQIGYKYEATRPRWNEDECRAGWGRIKRNVEAAREDMIQFCLSQGWKALGYRTLDALCDEQLFGVRFAAIEQRQEFVKEATLAGVPQRTISTFTGQNRQTTLRDQRAVGVRPDPPTMRQMSQVAPRNNGTNVPSTEPIEGVLIDRDVPQWSAPRRDPALVMAYEEGWTETPPPPDLRCVEETITLLRTGADLIPHEPLVAIYRASRNACFRLGITVEEPTPQRGMS